MIAEFNIMKGSFTLNLKEKVKAESGWSYPFTNEKLTKIFYVNYYSPSPGIASRSNGYLVKPQSGYYLIGVSNKVFRV